MEDEQQWERLSKVSSTAEQHSTGEENKHAGKQKLQFYSIRITVNEADRWTVLAKP